MQENIDRDLKELVAKDARLTKARGCEVCGGNGWVETAPETWLALDYSEKCRTRAIGCNPQLDEARRGAKYRVFCECQQTEEGEG